MTVDPTRPSRTTRQGSWPATSAVVALVRARRRGHREPCSTPVQQAGRAAVDASTAATEDTSLATSRWRRSRDCRRKATSEHSCCCCQSHCSFLSPYPYPCLCHRCWGWGQEGEGPPEDMTVPAAVGVEAAAAAKGALLLRSWTRTWRSVPGPPSGPARSP
jgi:hypothetical protein